MPSTPIVGIPVLLFPRNLCTKTKKNITKVNTCKLNRSCFAFFYVNVFEILESHWNSGLLHKILMGWKCLAFAVGAGAYAVNYKTQCYVSTCIYTNILKRIFVVWRKYPICQLVIIILLADFVHLHYGHQLKTIRTTTFNFIPACIM